MWRDWTTHQPKETKFLAEATEMVLADQEIGRQVSEVLEKAQADKIMARLFSSISINGLGLPLSFLYAIVNDKIHLSEIEELRRDKMFFGEIDEAEETIKEKAASLEVFILAHKLGKLEVEQAYAHRIVNKEYLAGFQELAKNFRLSPEDTEDVFHLIILHEKVIEDFSHGPAKPTYEYLEKYCQKYGRDADDFLDLLLSALILLMTTDAERLSKVCFNFLSAERHHAPERGAARLLRQTEKKKRAEQIRWHEAGLAGDDLMKLLNMKPGPEFGRLLASIHAFAKGEAEAPEMSAEVKSKILNRVTTFRSL